MQYRFEFYRVKNGTVRIVKNGCQLCVRDEGTVLGEMSFLGRAVATADVQADSDGTQVYQMSEEYLNDIFQSQPLLCSKFYWNLAKNLAELLVSCDAPTLNVQQVWACWCCCAWL
jgi:CRP-like cAMP-binding protein